MPSIQKRCVIEGLTAELAVVKPEAGRFAKGYPTGCALYGNAPTGNLASGILLDAFEHMDEYQLWLCGKGDMEAGNHRKAQQTHGQRPLFRLRTASTGDIPAIAGRAMLINPRTNEGVYTQYSFPSKTMEYMRAGKPVLCCKLDGIPA